jgi:ubiquitin carboxyl-terminal hydrolase MINDY-1/2
MVTTSPDASPPPAPIYALKRVPFAGRDVTIVLQADNGPCPLLAVANALLLRGGLSLPPGASDFVPEEVLLAAVREYLLRTSAAAPDANAAAVLSDALALLPSLSAGLDVNVRFGDVEGFEYTRELSFFDLAGVRLLHGWVVDPQEPAAAHLRERSYNQAMEALVAAAAGQPPSEPTPAAPAAGDVTDAGAPAAANGASPPVNDTPAAPTEAAAVPADAAAPAPAAAAADPFADLVSAELGGAGDDALPPPDQPAAPATPSLPAGAAAVPAADAPAAADGAPRDPLPSAGTAAAVAAATIDSWLRDTSSQLTYFGLLSLHERVQEGEVAVLFRNCHFGTLHKAGGRLFTLVTDVGYRHLPQVVWECLDEVGATDFYDARFTPCDSIDERAAEAAAAAAAASAGGPVPVALPAPGDPSAPGGGGDPVPVATEYRPAGVTQPDGAPLVAAAAGHPQHAHDPDYLLALRLQQEEEEAHRREAVAAAAAAGTLPAPLHPSLVAAGAPAAGGAGAYGPAAHVPVPPPPPHAGGSDPRNGSADGDDDEAGVMAAVLEASRREYEAEQQRARALGYVHAAHHATPWPDAAAAPAPAPALTISRPPPVATGPAPASGGSNATPTPRSGAATAASSAQPQPAPRVPQPGRNDRYGAQAAQLRAAAQEREARRASQTSTPTETPTGGADGRNRKHSGDGCAVM